MFRRNDQHTTWGFFWEQLIHGSSSLDKNGFDLIIIVIVNINEIYIVKILTLSNVLSQQLMHSYSFNGSGRRCQ